MKEKKRLYPDSRVELTSFAEKYYDIHLDIVSFGLYKPFIKKVIKSLNIQPEDKIIDFGCGTGRNACLMAKYLNSKGKIIGIDISEIMHKQFEKKCKKTFKDFGFTDIKEKYFAYKYVRLLTAYNV